MEQLIKPPEIDEPALIWHVQQLYRATLIYAAQHGKVMSELRSGGPNPELAEKAQRDFEQAAMTFDAIWVQINEASDNQIMGQVTSGEPATESTPGTHINFSEERLN